MAMVAIGKEGTARLPWTPRGALDTAEIEYVAGTLRQILDQNPKGAVKRAVVTFPVPAPDGTELELGCWLQSILPKLAPLEDVVLEFIQAPMDLAAMLSTPLSAMPKTRIKVSREVVETLD